MADGKSKKMKWSDLVKGLEGIETGTPLAVEVERETIPIIFVPGIMGSRLGGPDGKVWDPDDKGFMLWNYGMAWVGPDDKKKRVIGDDFDEDRLKPLDADAKHNGKQKFTPQQIERGWGTVLWGSYGEVITTLQADASWATPLKAFFDLPVYAFGYNWTASNLFAGKQLAAKIKAIVEGLQGEGKLCRKVILVTHSMGGLVARCALQEPGVEAQVFGVIHGVQPALGAAGAYWRMKAGFERTDFMSRISAWVLGTNGAEVTALLCWMPGGLQLLPGPDYTDNGGSKQWLKFQDQDGKELKALPASDPYEEIYKVDEEVSPEAYWRLVRKDHLVPEKQPKVGPKAAWAKYCKKVSQAKAVHVKLKGKAHPETQPFFGAGKAHATVDRIVFKLAPYELKALSRAGSMVAGTVATYALLGPVAAGAYAAFQAFKRTEYWTSRGAFELKIKADDGRSLSVDMLHPADLAKLDQDPHGAGAGDGTVPESSGKAIPASGDAAKGATEARGFEGIGHEPAFHAEQGTPADNPVAYTVAAVSRLCWREIKKAKG